ncbi:hypothetical protein [Rickettsia endosymbiont of Cardiosporidium cionae]|uniref:hypothetical protein n=1 Tax=Rickettsia endosymbiont of Cardiosporidium cionae TaxID=2777155 RepID=UPI0018942AAD|nr:hypothetical protein [Rickettsia endosymbiont of Cardiosporidium cionae]KAF8818082.1 hypothetical protein IHI24_000881 [Rickettsia endosymbiont of Cardiosporidium cionae]
MLEFPVTLPSPLVEGYRIRPDDALVRTDMDSGPSRQRRRFTSTTQINSVVWRLKQSQMALFESWYRRKAREGAAFFKIDLLAGVGFTEHEARFFEQYTTEFLGADAWMVRANLEIRTLPLIDNEIADLLSILRLEDINIVVESYHSFLHATLSGIFL